jgi:hypothetical protein
MFKTRHGALAILAAASAVATGVLPAPLAAAVRPCPETLTVETGGRSATGVLIAQIISIEGTFAPGRYPFIYFGADGLYMMDDGSRVRVDC